MCINNLENARNEINEIDKKMAELFCKRMDAIYKIACYKNENNLKILDKNREIEIIKQNLDYINNKDFKEYYIEFMNHILEISKTYQNYLLNQF